VVLPPVMPLPAAEGYHESWAEALPAKASMMESAAEDLAMLRL